MLKFHALKVLQISQDAEDAVQIALEVPAALREEYRGSPGQHVVVRVMSEGEELRRTYSLVSAPGEQPLRIAPRVHPSGRMSRHLAEQLRSGESLDVLPPNGSFTPRSAAATGGTYVAFAAGCGITPVLSVVRALLAGGAARVLLFYGNTGTSRTMCLEELLALKDRHLEQLALHFVMSREPQEVELYNGRLDAARVRQFAATLFDPAAVREFFVCGPGDMIEQVSATLRDLGEGARLHAEHFARDGGPRARHARRPSRQAPLRRTRPRVGQVRAWTRRRRTFTMKVEGETVLAALARRHRVALLLSGRRVLDLPHQGGEGRGDAATELCPGGLGARAGLRAGLSVPRETLAAGTGLRREIIAAAAVSQRPEYAGGLPEHSLRRH
jgi:ring-1,2-phenylacetyl-CoA epoxidase subunit PaaE